MLRTLATSSAPAGVKEIHLPSISAVTEDESTGEVVIFALNRNLGEPMDSRSSCAASAARAR